MAKCETGINRRRESIAYHVRQFGAVFFPDPLYHLDGCGASFGDMPVVLKSDISHRPPECDFDENNALDPQLAEVRASFVYTAIYQRVNVVTLIERL